MIVCCRYPEVNVGLFEMSRLYTHLGGISSTIVLLQLLK